MSKNKQHDGKSGHDDQDHHGSGHKGKLLIGTNGDNDLAGGSGNDLIFGRNGNDTLDGGAGNDWLFGGKGDDRLLGGAGNDRLDGGKGDDFLDGGAGNDKVLGGKGDDVANFTLSENHGAHDVYDGGKGFDTLRLTLTTAEAKLAEDEIAAFKGFLHDGGKVFYFASLGLTVRNFEALDVVTIGGNTAPVAGNDTPVTDEDTPIVFNALANDTDAEGSMLTVALFTDPAHGSVTLNGDGSFTYTPDADFNGTDSFTYVANDGALDSNPATVNLTINAVNDKPLADPDAYSTNEDTPLSVAAAQGVLVGDTDVDGDALSAILVAGPVHGALALQSDGSFVYTPNLNYFGPDSFTYKAFDGSLYSDDATVSLSVNVPPVARNDVIERTGAGGPIHVAVLAGAHNSAADTVTQLNNQTTPFAIFAKEIDVSNDSTTNWSAVLAQYDVVVVGENGLAPFDYDGSPNLFTALVDSFIEGGHGVVSTGVFASRIGGYINAIVNARADDISPTGTFGDSIFVGSGSITVDPTHPITAGVPTTITISGLYELANIIDPGSHTLATFGSNKDAAIVYADNVGPETARTVFLGAVHMAGPGFSPDWTRVPGSPVDQILKQAVAWATGTATDEDTPLVIDSATLLANDEPGNGGPLDIASVSATSTLGALVSLDTGGNIVYDPTAALNYLNAGEIVHDSFDYRVIDSNGAEAVATASLSVAGRAELVTAGVTTFASFEESLDYGLGQAWSPSTPDADTLL